MPSTTEILRLLLAAILLVAAAAKLLDRKGSTDAVRGFGVPRPIAGVAALGLPVLEAAVAAALLPAGSARVGAAAAACLFATFALVVAALRIRGLSPDCHCFGRLHSAPAGWAVTVRNTGLAGAAAVVAIAPASPISVPALAVFAGSAVVVGQGVLSLVLLRRYGRALQRIEQLEQRAEDDVRLFVGEPVPPFALDTAAGGELTLGGLLASGRPLVLVFTDLRCGACSALYPVVAGWQEELRELATVVVVASGEEEGVRAIAQEHGLDLERVLLGEWGLIRAYALDATPAALLLDRDGRVTVEAVYGADAIVELVADAFVLDNPAAAHV